MEKVHIGTMGWSYSFWAGNFYPEGILPKEMLTEYSKHCDTVEVDSTFYRIPETYTIEKWRNQTPADFIFSAKLPRRITHEKMLKNCEREMTRFIDSVSRLQNKLGPLLIQLPSTFRPEHIERLRDFLPSLPQEHHFALEVRNKGLLGEALYSLLRNAGVALAFVDSPNMPMVEQFTADFSYIRWEGDRSKVRGTMGKVEVDKTSAINAWAVKIRRLVEDGNEIFGYFSKYYSGHPPKDAKQLLELLR